MKSLFGFPNVKVIAVPATSFLHWENIAAYLTKRQVHKMYVFKMFVTAVFVIFLIKLRWSKTKSLYNAPYFLMSVQ